MAERIWAPWRMEYILGPKSGPCIFCEFPARPVERYREDLVLVVQAHAYVCLNRYPFTAGHVLVCPRRHASEMTELPPEEYAAFMELVRATVTCLRVAMQPDGFNVGINLGKASGAGIADHLHAHIVPRWVGDQNFMPVVGDTRVMPEHLDATWLRLRPAFDALTGAKAPLDTA
jgi:ATP adenylyltransferase